MSLETSFMARLGIAAIIVYFLVSLEGCFDPIHSELNGFIYRITDHLKTAEIKSKPFKIPVFKKVELLAESIILKDGKREWLFHPLPKRALSRESGVIETVFTFEDPNNKTQKEAVKNPVRRLGIKDFVGEDQFAPV